MRGVGGGVSWGGTSESAVCVEWSENGNFAPC